MLINNVSLQGAGPDNLSVNPSGRHVLVANYAGGTVAVLPIQPNGPLGSVTDAKQDKGPVRPTHAANAPPGSFAINGHDRPPAHMIQADLAPRFPLTGD